MDSQACTVCPSTFNSESHQCVSFASNLAANNSWISDSAEKSLNNSNTMIEQGASPCAAETPFYDGSSCIKCEAGQVFNVDSQKCQNCTAENFNVQEHSCHVLVSNLTQNGSWISEKPTETLSNATELMNKVESDPCPTETPFYDGTSCTNCTEGQVFDADTKKCTTCPDGSAFSADAHKCAPLASNLETNQSWVGETPADSIQQNKDELAQGSQACPAETPFFDGT